MGYTIVQKGTAALSSTSSVLRVGNYLFVCRSTGTVTRYTIDPDGTIDNPLSVTVSIPTNMCVSQDAAFLYVSGGTNSARIANIYAIRISDMALVNTALSVSGSSTTNIKGMECDSLGNIHITTDNPSAIYRVGQFNGSAFSFATVESPNFTLEWALTVNGSRVILCNGTSTNNQFYIKEYAVSAGTVTPVATLEENAGSGFSAPCIINGKIYAIFDKRYLREYATTGSVLARVGTSELDLGVAVYERAAYDGTYIYAYRNQSGSSNITIIDPSTFSVVRTFPVSGVATTGVGVRIVHRYGANGIVWCNTGNVYSGDTALAADFTLSATSIAAGQTITATAI